MTNSVKRLIRLLLPARFRLSQNSVLLPGGDDADVLNHPPQQPEPTTRQLTGAVYDGIRRITQTHAPGLGTVRDEDGRILTKQQRFGKGGKNILANCTAIHAKRMRNVWRSHTRSGGR